MPSLAHWQPNELDWDEKLESMAVFFKKKNFVKNIAEIDLVP